MKMLFEGSISVKAVMLAEKRKVSKIFIDQNKHDKDTDFIIKLARSKAIEIVRSKREEIDKLTEKSSHGGVIAYASDRINDELDKLLDRDFLCLLEGIEDPFNFGYCLRNLYAAGCGGVLVSERNWLDSSTTVCRSSAGASEYLNIHVYSDLEKTLTKIKKSHLIICAARKDAISIYQQDYQRPLLLAIGGEKRGLSKIVNEFSDQNVFIPYANEFRNALNASSAVSVIAFEIYRQKEMRQI